MSSNGPRGLARILSRWRKPAPAPDPGPEAGADDQEPSLLDELPGVLEALNDSTRQFNDVAQEQKKGVLHQSSSLHQVAVTSEEMAAGARQISQNTDHVEQAALASISRCIQGRQTLTEATTEMETMADRVQSLAENIQELGRHNHRIAGVADIITEITDQLNLMALNAEIEAAGAGQFGKRFGVVAREVKRLSDNSRESTIHIKGIISEILNDLVRISAAADQSLEATRNARGQIQRVSADIKAIHSEIERTHALAREIKVATHQQTTAQQELSDSLNNVDSVTLANAEMMTARVDTAINNLSDLAQYVTLIIETSVLRDKP